MSHSAGLYRPRSATPSSQPSFSKKPRVQSPEHDSGPLDTVFAQNPAQDSTELQVDKESNISPEIPKRQVGKSKSKKAKRRPPPESGSPEDVNLRDVFTLLGEEVVSQAEREERDYDAPVELYSEVELTVRDISSSGESISLLPGPHTPWAVLVPFALPAETIRARVYRHSRLHSYADLLEVITPNLELRDDSLVRCRYFGTCGGCQYQMIPYHQQLAFKRRVVEKAYATYSGLNPDQVPAVLPTIPSPNQYGYRTKITPHFDAPPKGKKTEAQGASGSTDPLRKEWELRIGFDQKGRRTVMDIEECPIATDVLNKGLEIARKNVQQTISTYKKGATLLLRDSLAVPVWETNLSNGEEAFTKSMIAETDDQDERHYCITSHKATVRERVGDTLFEFSAGSFFQNNNSALEPLTSHVRDAIFSSSEGEALEPGSTIRKSPTHLVDTYCGSGLFSLTLSPHFSHVAGIEIDSAAIRAAQHNTNLNGLSLSKHKFHAGKSEDIFASVLSSSEETFPPDDTVVVVDPPRKGCDEAFIDQVVSFGPSVLVYVSCNVHTQARDVGMLIRKMEVKGEGSYVLDSLRGFDLFPQTAHVESVAVLRRVVVHSVFH